MVRKAIRLTRSEKPGAVLLELPEDIAKMDAKAELIEPHRYRRPQADEIEYVLDIAVDLFIRDYAMEPWRPAQCIPYALTGI